MPLDTGAVTPVWEFFPEVPEGGDGSVRAPTLEQASDIGAGFRALREHYGLSLDDVAMATRISKRYLRDLEAMRLDLLPARPFVIGYVRAYAEALGLDPSAAAARFKQDAPDGDQVLHAPIGVRRERDARLKLLFAAGVAVVLAVGAWNIAKRAMSAGSATAPGGEIAASSLKVQSSAAHGPLVLGQPLPAPPESTTPTPYVTPGLETSTAGGAPGQAGSGSASAAPVAVADPGDPLGSAFQAKGVVYGVPAAQSQVTLQATKTGSLIVRGPDGAVYFARLLTAGQAYRAPTTDGLSVEVSDPAIFQVYVNGLLTGPPPAAQSLIAKLAQTAPTPPGR